MHQNVIICYKNALIDISLICVLVWWSPMNSDVLLKQCFVILLAGCCWETGGTKSLSVLQNLTEFVAVLQHCPLMIWFTSGHYWPDSSCACLTDLWKTRDCSRKAGLWPYLWGSCSLYIIKAKAESLQGQGVDSGFLQTSSTPSLSSWKSGHSDAQFRAFSLQGCS